MIFFKDDRNGIIFEMVLPNSENINFPWYIAPTGMTLTFKKPCHNYALPKIANLMKQCLLLNSSEIAWPIFIVPTFKLKRTRLANLNIGRRFINTYL